MSKAYDKQIAWKSHYQKYKIQPSKFVVENEMLLYPEGCAIKYICKTSSTKERKQDLEKAIHFIEMIIERDYDADTTVYSSDRMVTTGKFSRLNKV